MPTMPIINLFNSYDLQADPYEFDKINCQEVVDYCETRFRSALQAMLQATDDDKIWMTKILFRELVMFISLFIILTNSFEGVLLLLHRCGSGDRTIGQHSYHCTHSGA